MVRDMACHPDVQRRKGVVEQVDVGPRVRRPGEADARALAAGQGRRAGDEGAVAVAETRKVDMEAAGPDALGVPLRVVGPPEQDVVADAAADQDGLLADAICGRLECRLLARSTCLQRESRRVDLPQPMAPVMTVSSPGPMDREPFLISGAAAPGQPTSKSSWERMGMSGDQLRVVDVGVSSSPRPSAAAILVSDKLRYACMRLLDAWTLCTVEARPESWPRVALSMAKSMMAAKTSSLVSGRRIRRTTPKAASVRADGIVCIPEADTAAFRRVSSSLARRSAMDRTKTGSHACILMPWIDPSTSASSFARASLAARLLEIQTAMDRRRRLRTGNMIACVLLLVNGQAAQAESDLDRHVPHVGKALGAAEEHQGVDLGEGREVGNGRVVTAGAEVAEAERLPVKRRREGAPVLHGEPPEVVAAEVAGEGAEDAGAEHGYDAGGRGAGQQPLELPGDREEGGVAGEAEEGADDELAAVLARDEAPVQVGCGRLGRGPGGGFDEPCLVLFRRGERRVLREVVQAEDVLDLDDTAQPAVRQLLYQAAAAAAAAALCRAGGHRRPFWSRRAGTGVEDVEERRRSQDPGEQPVQWERGGSRQRGGVEKGPCQRAE
ncbi:hypothetical protein ColKHC_09578 [Colletotrichum higginsianum]|nr:hypothetical protein ColKHC_09578 [Colletotrichum higginsianum]